MPHKKFNDHNLFHLVGFEIINGKAHALAAQVFIYMIMQSDDESCGTCLLPSDDKEREINVWAKHFMIYLFICG